MTWLGLCFHLLKLEPSMSNSSMESLYLVGSKRNFNLGNTSDDMLGLLVGGFGLLVGEIGALL